MANPLSVLIVDDDPLVRETLEDLLDDAGYAATTVEDADAALELTAERDFDAILTDIRMPGRDGIALLGALRELRPRTPVLLMTGFASIDSAVTAMRSGAFDYITKPFRAEAVLAALERATSYAALDRENQQLRRAVDRTSGYGDLIGSSPAMRDIYALIQRIHSSSSSVLITGESGTGKDVVARTIHFAGPRAKRPFVPINCTAMPEGLLESELFGHVRGAFTGAHVTKHGLFEEAHCGTLFLDEIGDMPPALQAKMLRVLQDREIRPVGGTKAVKVDTRIIAATNKDLRAEIEAGRFRKDLYYRLNVIPIAIPPLRERPEDIDLLAEAFLRKHAGERAPRLSTAALAALKRHTWEGNARELENAIERALVLRSGDEISPADLVIGEIEDCDQSDFESALLEQAFRQRLTIHELSARYIDKVLAETGGSKTEAARVLGVNRRTLYRRDKRAAAAASEPEAPGEK